MSERTPSAGNLGKAMRPHDGIIPPPLRRTLRTQVPLVHLGEPHGASSSRLPLAKRKSSFPGPWSEPTFSAQSRRPCDLKISRQEDGARRSQPPVGGHSFAVWWKRGRDPSARVHHHQREGRLRVARVTEDVLVRRRGIRHASCLRVLLDGGWCCWTATSKRPVPEPDDPLLSRGRLFQ